MKKADSKIRIITADDHALIRQGIIYTLSKEKDFELVGEAGNASELHTLLLEKNCDVLLLDIDMPGSDVFKIITKVRSLQPATRILIVSMYPEKQMGTHMLKAGVDGYLDKSKELNLLSTAIRTIHSGEKYISSTMASELAVRLSTDIDPVKHESLSEREFQVLIYIAQGKRVSDISEKLCLSVKTVSTYRRRLLNKLELENNTQLIKYAVQYKLI